MNAFLLRAGFFFALTGVTIAAESQVRVAASRELRIAIVDSSRVNEARGALHQAFATSVSAALTRQCGGHVGVRGKCVSVDHAAFNLHAGVYDAVLVMGRDVPTPLRRLNAITLSAVPSGSRRDNALYFLIPEGDESLQGLLASAFTRTMGDDAFLQVLARAEGRALPAGEKVAAAQ